jgi:hypothetical protein
VIQVLHLPVKKLVFINIKKNIMKKIFQRQTYLMLFCSIMLSLTTVISFAQDGAASSGGSAQTTTSTTSVATTIPMWAWVLGGVIVLAIIIGLLSRKGRDIAHTDKVTYTKTTSSE